MFLDLPVSIREGKETFRSADFVLYLFATDSHFAREQELRAQINIAIAISAKYPIEDIFFFLLFQQSLFATCRQQFVKICRCADKFARQVVLYTYVCLNKWSCFMIDILKSAIEFCSRDVFLRNTSRDDTYQSSRDSFED